MTLTTAWGIPIRLHWSFLALAALYVSAQAISGGGAAAAQALALGTVLIASVLLHELGHARVARRFGIETRDITLYPFGGIAALQGEPSTPRAELWIALAGPAVNMVLAAGALVLALLEVPGMVLVFGVNLVMGLFNLVPAWPMDGGRVARALWTPRLGHRAATLRALRVSRWFAWAFLAVGLFTNGGLALVGGLLLLMTGAERRRIASGSEFIRPDPVRVDGPRRDVWIDAPERALASGLWEHPVAGAADGARCRRVA